MTMDQYVVERFQHVDMLDVWLRTYSEEVKKFKTKEKAESYVSKHENDVIKPIDQINDLEYHGCTWVYEIKKVEGRK